jgi:outer membrane lipoprotein-sorting protein
MNSFDWDDEHRESPAAIEDALQKVRKDGDRKKVQRRSMIVTGTAALLAVVTFGALQFTSDKASNNSNNIAAPTTTPSTPTSEIQLSLAAKVTQTAAASLASTKSISFTQKITNHRLNLDDYNNIDSSRTLQYRVDTDGSYWGNLTEDANADGTQEFSYSAKTGVTVDCYKFDETNCFRNYQPEGKTPQFGTIINRVEQAALAKDAKATEGSTDNSKIWTLEYNAAIPFSNAIEHVTMTVDQATGFPVHIVSTINGKPNSETFLTELHLNPTFTPQQFNVSLTKGVAVHDQVTQKLTAKEQRTFGNSVDDRVASTLPMGTVKGYATNEVWTTITGRSPGFSAGQCLIDNGQDVSSDSDFAATYATQIGRKDLVNYRLSSIDRSTCDSKLNMEDFLTDFNRVKLAEKFTATSGAMTGATFSIYQDTDGSLVMGAENSKLLTYVTGDLNVEELKELANSLTTK